MWVRKWKSSKEVNDRLLVLTSFELFTIKIGRLKHTVGNRYALVDLEEAVITPDDEGLTLTFSPAKTLRYADVPDETIAAILSSYLRLTTASPAMRKAIVWVKSGADDNDYPPYQAMLANEAADRQKWEAANYRSSSSPPGRGVIAAYLGYAARNDWAEYTDCIYKALVRCVKSHRPVLDLTPTSSVREAFASANLGPLLATLRVSDFVTHIRASETDKPDILTALASVMDVNPGVVSISLTSINIKKGVSALSKALATRMTADNAPMLTELSFPGVPLKDKGLKALLKGLVSTPSLVILNLKECSLTSSGLASLFKSLRSEPLITALRYLNVSLNKLGKKGSKALSLWLQSPAAGHVENLVLNHAHLRVEELFDALPAEKGTASLRSLFLGGVSVPDKHALSMGTSLRLSAITNLNLLEGIFTPVSLSSVVSAYLSNDSVPSVKINLARTNMTANASGLDDAFVASSLGNAFRQGARLERLVIDDIILSTHATVALVDALDGLPMLGHLSMCRVVSKKQADQATLASALARLLQNPDCALHTLWLIGSKKNNFGPAICTVLEAAKEQPRLTSVTVAGNWGGDASILAACNFLSSSPSISAFSISDSGFTAVSTLSTMADIVPDVPTLKVFPMPVDDLTALFRKTKKSKRADVEALVAKLRRRGTLKTRPVSIATGATTHHSRKRGKQAQPEGTQGTAAAAGKGDQAGKKARENYTPPRRQSKNNDPKDAGGLGAAAAAAAAAGPPSSGSSAPTPAPRPRQLSVAQQESRDIKRFSALMLGTFDPMDFGESSGLGGPSPSSSSPSSSLGGARPGGVPVGKDRSGSLAFAGSGSILDRHMPPPTSRLRVTVPEANYDSGSSSDSSGSSSSSGSGSCSDSLCSSSSGVLGNHQDLAPIATTAAHPSLSSSGSDSYDSDGSYSDDSGSDDSSDDDDPPAVVRIRSVKPSTSASAPPPKPPPPSL